MKSIIQNFFVILRRFRAATLLNLLGLSVAFAAFIMILIQVNYEQSFDTCHPESDRIFLATIKHDGSESAYENNIQSRGFVDEFIASSPTIEAATLYNPFIPDIYIAVGEGSDRKGFQEKLVTCYPDITRIFGFVFTEGSGESLHDPEKVIIPESMARRFYGDAPAVGQMIHINELVWTKTLKNYTVGGVYKDFPGNTQLDNVIYGTIDNTMKGDWMSGNFLCYVLLSDKNAAGPFMEEFNKSFDFSPVWNPNGDKLSLALMPLTDIHYMSNDSSLFKLNNKNTVRLLFTIALLIIIIAAINFTNFSIALAPLRIKSVNTRKVFGSSTAEQQRLLLTEAIGITFFSWLLSLAIVWLLNKNHWVYFLDADLSLSQNLPLILISAGIALLIGFVAGYYPAHYMTSFQPAVALKGNFGTSPSGRILRKGLVGFQYIISIGLIIAALFIQLQNHFMRSYDYGFDRDHLAVVELNGAFYANNRDTYVNRLKQHPGIDDVAFSKQKLGARDGYTTYGLEYNDQSFYGYALEVSASFPRVMGIPIVEGRDFLPTDEQIGELRFIFSKPIQQAIGMHPGSNLKMTSWGASGSTIGITEDIKFTSLRQGEDPIYFMLNTGVALPVSYIRIHAGANIPETVDHIRQVVAEIDPTFPFELEFYDTIFNQLYQAELSMTNAVTLFSILAILISVVGVFGLILFETEFRKKEIGIRKVMGARVRDILLMFNKSYMTIVCVSFIVAAPIGYYFVDRWLENFSYKTPLYWWVFPLAFLLVALITIGTITFQNLQSAHANPVDSIKAE
ncbi:putative ABC transport system permease protein [Parabacteroides sp. PFB2-12]|uniref:ABC transporter permease n=1 Tax=unclassified Parabacteroides TaxID=2649774 RepID=UPI0024736EF2|nr:MULTISPECIES: ABC transporter permease [unclassified Parabacteroides]MDH6343949.1 putative ABC transport system permease protein [Parabacteroides sp. PM6-13]MDH6391690.1 putative ABC transport system permease protein [Parabacteroides sp. PFB2-12]